MIRPVQPDDLPAWIERTAEVEPLFGTMIGQPGFEEAIKAAVLAGGAFCHENTSRAIDGIIAIDRAGNEIAWLAVSGRSQGNGIGSRLVQRAVEELDSTREIGVQTFAAHVPDGAAARRLYLKFGFTDSRDSGKNPAGIDTVT